MQVQKKRLTNYSNEYKLRAKVIQMHNNCFDTLVGGLSRRELAARLSAPGA